MSYPIAEIKISSKDYPKLLAQIDDPPKQLYCRGNIKLLNSFCIGVVGTRKLTDYGKKATERIVSELADHNLTIVSGLAMGIDAVAHRNSLDNNLPTIAVLGSGVDDRRIYPGANFPLATDIMKNKGLIVSEYKEGTPGLRHHFPARNRIISGLSKGVLIIEAPEKSGAMITTRFATEQNRDVFAIPGNIFSLNSRGPNMLIQKGAKPVFSGQDILGAYYQNLELKLEQSNTISTTHPIEKKILDILDDKGELSGDQIISLSQLEPSQAIATLSMLELKNKIILKSNKYKLK